MKGKIVTEWSKVTTRSVREQALLKFGQNFHLVNQTVQSVKFIESLHRKGHLRVNTHRVPFYETPEVNLEDFVHLRGVAKTGEKLQECYSVIQRVYKTFHSFC